MKPIPKFLSKSKLMRSYRCEKAMYMAIHSPEREAPISEALQSLFDQGNEVGKEARSLFPNGELVDCKPWEFVQSAQRTKELIDQGAKTIYEAAFIHQGCYCRMDIIHYSEETQKWSLYEVKSSTSYKEEHLDDVSLQSWIIAGSGLKIDKIHLVHLNKNCVYPKLDDLFQIVDITDGVRECYLNVSTHLKEVSDILTNPEQPNTPIGEHCMLPSECGFKDFCWKKESQLPELSLLNLPRFKKKWEFLKKGIVDINDDRVCDLNPHQERILNCHKENKRYVDIKEIKKNLEDWSFPFVFLDFETISPAIPKFDGCSPYTQTPFQFSVHILRDFDTEPEHYEFLHEKETDPRPSLIEDLLKFCEQEGTLIAYYDVFEKKVIAKLAECFPEHKERLLLLNERMKDPLPILRESFYDPQFQMSYSLKNVAPALLGSESSYEGMEVGDGTSAQRAYKKMAPLEDSSKEKQELKQYLLEYCKKDTEVLMKVVLFLFELSK